MQKRPDGVVVPLNYGELARIKQLREMARDIQDLKNRLAALEQRFESR